MIVCLQLQGCCCSKGAAGALRAAPPPPAPDNGLNRALLPKAKFVICHFSHGCFSSWLLPKWPKNMLRCRAARLAGGRARGLGVPGSSACVTIAEEMLREGSALWVPAPSRGDCGCYWSSETADAEIKDTRYRTFYFWVRHSILSPDILGGWGANAKCSSLPLAVVLGWYLNAFYKWELGDFRLKNVKPTSFFLVVVKGSGRSEGWHKEQIVGMSPFSKVLCRPPLLCGRSAGCFC